MKLLLATRNAHKAREFAEMLGSWEVLTLKDVGFEDEIVENGNTFDDNARIKAKALLPFIQARGELDAFVICADDSGLEVDALHGAPGVHSARYAGLPSRDEANTAKLLDALKGIPGPARTARFRCVIAAAKSGASSVQTFQGSCEGKIGFRQKGTQGFGYDPVFFPIGFCRTFAEISADEKNQVSHRSQAVAAFREWLKAEFPS